MKTGQQEYDKLCNGNWDLLLKMFHRIEESVQDKKKQYSDLKSLALTKTLSPRQVDGIIGRCNYRIHLIENPNEEPFANNERVEKRLTLSKEKANGEQQQAI